MHKKVVAVILIALMLLGIFPPYFVYHNAYGATISDPRDINPPAGSKLKVDNSTAWYSAGFWKIYVDGKLTGDDLCVVDDLKLSHTGNLWNMLHKNTINAWLDAFTPVPSPTGYYSDATFSKKLGSYDPYNIKTITYGGKTSQRLHIREAGKLAGVASITYDENKKEVYVQTTQFPTGGISFPSGVKEGDKINFQIRGTAYANIQAKTITYEFYIDGKVAASNTLSKTTFNETVTKTLTAGTHSLMLKVTDGVGRTTTYTKSITVQPGSLPPPPPGSIQAGIRLDLDPSSLKVGTTGNVSATIDASSSSSSGSGPYSARFWLQVNGVDLLGKDGTAITGLTSLSQAKYTKLISNAKPGDKVWAKVRVWDASINKTAEAETTKIIGQYEHTPPPPEEEPTPPPAPEPEPPVAGINAPSEVIQGEDVRISSSSYDPDGTIEDYDWRITPSTGVVGTLSGKSGTIYFDNVGTYTIKLTVTDSDGLTDTVQKTLEVKPAIPKAFFDYIGTLKENRKVVLDASNSYTSPRYPMIWEATEWQIIPPAGGSESDIKIVSSPDMQKRTVLFKKAGDYRVRVRVKNSAGHYSEWYERVLTIYPDLPPVADFYVYSTVLRDPEDGNYASIQLFDISYSSDGDTINSRIWRYKYDSDNDGSFDDESWVVLDDGNNLSPILKTKNVGKYLFELSVKEGFGEETIPEFISPSDYRTDDTSDKPINDKVCEVINLQPVVDFEALKKIKADVVFTVGATDASKTNNLNSKINSIVKTKLAAKNIDANITAIQTEVISSNDINASEIFNKWQKYPLINDPKFDAGWKLDNDRIYTTDNVHWTGFWDNTKQYSKDYTIEFDVMTTEHIDPWGFTFRMTSPEHDTYSFYAVEWDPRYDTITLAKVTRWKPNASDPTHGGPVYHGQISGADGTYESRSYFGGALRDCSGSILVRTNFDVQYNRWDHARLEVYGNHIVVWINGYKVIDYIDTNNPLLSGSYGPYTASQYNTSFKNIRITSTNYKSLDEALKTTTWQDNSVRFLVNISDIELPELNDQVKLGDILSRMLSAGAYFIGLGTDTNRSQYQTFISRNDGKGVFYYNTNMDTALNQVADYIISVIESMPKLLEQYVLLGEEVTYNTYYSDPETDPKYQERWIYQHDPNYFENSLGLAPFSGQYISGPVTVFDKVGKYEVQFQARDNPKADNRFDNYRLWSYMPLNKLELYVHRKPIASFTANLTRVGTAYQVQLSSTSYDLDHQSEPGKGIVEEEWKWKETTATSWNSGKPSTLGVNKTYLVWLRVKDKEGVWSDPYVSVLSTMQVNLAPIAMFTVDPNTQVVNKTISISDMSYDPNGDPIAERSWRVQKPDGTWVNYGSTPPTNIPSLGVGTYTIELKVRDNPQFGTPLWSEAYTQQVTVIPDNNKPVARFTIGPNPVVADEPYTLNDTSYDPDNDTIVAREWKVQKPDGTWVTISQWKPTFEEMGLGDDGTYKIQLRVLDDPSRRHPALAPMWSDPYVVTVQVQGRLIVIGDSNKTTYKAGEAMILYARTEGKAYRVEAKMWYSRNEFTSSNVTTLVPDTPLTSPPQDVMTWHTKHTKAEGRDVVVIIPKNIPDGNYQVVFTAYKQLAGGGTKTATDTITVRVKGTIYDHSKSQIIGPRF